MTRSTGGGGGAAGPVTESTLGEAMRAPSTTTPDVVVLSSVDQEAKPKQPDPKQDLWLSSVDGRHQSPIIPVRVGPHAETFYVHRAILTKSEYFKRALEGGFREAKEGAIDLPVEDPTLFSYVVAFLYEDKYVPIKPVSTILVADPDKGKGKETLEDSGSEDGSDDGSASDASTRSRRLMERRRRRQEREWEDRQRKQPGRHRPDCNCTSCRIDMITPTCWNCGIGPRVVPPRNPRYRNHPPVPGPAGRHGRPPNPRIRNRRRGSQLVEEPTHEPRMSPEDLHTWELAYSLSVDVYVCAQRYLLTDFQGCIASCIINNFEIAGIDAALPSVLVSCKTLYDGVSSSDPLLKKVFARVGFLQNLMWKKFPEETSSFYAENPELAPLIMKEMVEKRDEDGNAYDLPAMERSAPLYPFRGEEIIVNDYRGYRDPIRY